MTQTNTGVAGERLKNFHSTLDHLDDQMADLREERKAVMKDMKAEGFDLKVIREQRRLMKMKAEDRAELRDMLDMYMQAMGLLD